MKKSLLAVAVAAALPAAAFAQSTTNVTMYGIADLSVASVNNGSASALRVDSGAVSTSRWGVRGTEDLGGGLKALFNFEAGIAADTGATDASGTFQRRSVVGLNGGFGEVRLGRDYTPAFAAAGRWDMMGYGFWGNMLNYTAGGGTSVRFSNAIFYDTPNMGGFTASLAYGMGEVVGDNSQGRGISANVGYAAGPMQVGAYYESTNNIPTAPAAVLTTKKVGIGGGYDFGMFALKASWQRTDPDGGNNNVTYWNLGGSVNAGAGKILAQYARTKYEAGGQASTIALAYDYPLSKRTDVYASFGRVGNDSNTATNLLSSATSVAPAAAGSNPRAVAVGIRHMF